MSFTIHNAPSETTGTIQVCSTDDLDSIVHLHKQAQEHQQLHGEAWALFDPAFILQMIHEQRMYKYVTGEHIGGIFSLSDEEPVIWDDKPPGEAIYPHRLVVAPQYRGRGVTVEIVGWWKKRAVQNNKKFVRIDTWSSSQGLINYYKRLGFSEAGSRKLPASSLLHPAYHHLHITRLEIDLAV